MIKLGIVERNKFRDYCIQQSGYEKGLVQNLKQANDQNMVVGQGREIEHHRMLISAYYLIAKELTGEDVP